MATLLWSAVCKERLDCHIDLHVSRYTYETPHDHSLSRIMCVIWVCIYTMTDSASKHALQGYFDSLRVELAPRGVRVCVVCPGYIKTQLSSNALRGDGRTHGVTDATTAAGMDPHYAAQKIVMAMATGERELVLAKMHHQLSVYLKVMCPSLLDWLLRRRSKVN